MSELTDLGKGLITNYVNLFNGRFISHLIGAIGSFLIIRILQPEEYGALSVAMAFPTMLMVFGNLGINTAVTRYVSKFKDVNLDFAKSVILSGMLFDFIFGSGLSILGYFISPYVFSVIYDKPALVNFGRLASIYSLTYWSFSSIFSGFLGFEMTNYNSRLWTAHYAFQTLFTVSLALAWERIEGAIVGYILGYAAATIYGLYILWNRKILTGAAPKLSTLTEMLKYSLPLVVSSSVGNIFGIYTTSIINRFLTVVDLSNLNAASKIGFFFDTIFNPLSFAVQPLLSKIDRSDSIKMVKVVTELMKLNSLLELPIIIAVIALANPIIDLIAGPQYSSASLYLRLAMIGFLLGPLSGRSVLGTLLIFQGYTKFSMKVGILNNVTYAVLTTLLVLKYGASGYFVSSWLSWIPGYIISFVFVRSIINYRFPWKLVGQIALLSCITLSPLFLIPQSINVYGIIISIPLFLVLVKLYIYFDIITKEEINVFLRGMENTNLRFMVKFLAKFLS
jgi:O-antigen/teichoic acid export membrane protein